MATYVGEDRGGDAVRHDDASYLTGQTIYPDGGRLALNYTMPVT